MDQIYNSMMAMLQQSVLQQETTQVRNAEKKEDTTFQDLLARKKAPAEKTPAEQPTEAESTAKDAAELPSDETVDLEEQLLAAAVSAMQLPVIPVTQMEPEQEQQGFTLPLVEQPVSLTERIPQTLNAATAATDVQPNVGEGQTIESVQLSNNSPAADGNLMDTETAEGKMEQSVDARDGAGDVVEESGTESPVFRNVKEIMVKVGETTAAGRGETVETPVSEQVGQQISQALERGEMRLSVRLNPERLGQIDVQLTLTRNGSLQVELRAENKVTQQLLEKEMGSLQHMLMRSTQQEVQIQVVRHQESQQQAFEDGRQGGQHQNPQQEHRDERHRSNDFLQQLRLGLIPLEAEAS